MTSRVLQVISQSGETILSSSPPPKADLTVESAATPDPSSRVVPAGACSGNGGYSCVMKTGFLAVVAALALVTTGFSGGWHGNGGGWHGGYRGGYYRGGYYGHRYYNAGYYRYNGGWRWFAGGYNPWWILPVPVPYPYYGYYGPGYGYGNGYGPGYGYGY
jgi:hypothetical protein